MTHPDRYLADVFDGLTAATTSEAAAQLAVHAAYELAVVDGLCLITQGEEHCVVALAQQQQTYRCDLRSSGMYRAVVGSERAGTRTLWGKEDVIELPGGDQQRIGLALIVPLQSASGRIAVAFFWQTGHTADPQQTRRLELLAKAVGLAADALRRDEQHALRQRNQDRTAAELQHRLRNNLALMRSIIRRSNQTSASPEHFALHLEARIGALSRTQAMLGAAGDAGIELEDLIRTELIASAVPERRYLVQGPPVRLHAKGAESLGLAMHELATNSLKFGAFATPGGTVAVTWAVTENPAPSRLKMRWIESGVTIASVAPRRRGFGQELLECTLPYELGAQCRLALNPGGLNCDIDMPLEACAATVEPVAQQAAQGAR
jgi:two-component sensor histidine kinase